VQALDARYQGVAIVPLTLIVGPTQSVHRASMAEWMCQSTGLNTVRDTNGFLNLFLGDYANQTRGFRI
jgi:hypothetical protein